MKKKKLLLTLACLSLTATGLSACKASHTHTWSDPEYTWSEDYKTCTASRVCSECNQKEEEIAKDNAITYKKDTDATCTADEKGHNHATFTNTAFTAQDSPKDSVPGTEKAHHTWGEPKYTWNDNYSSCTATRSCKNCAEEEAEAATITYIKDTAATCTADEKGHNHATFTNTAFTAQDSPKDSVPGTEKAKGHTLSKVEGFTAEGNNYGLKDHYKCSKCDGCFEDSEGKTAIEDIISWKEGDGLYKADDDGTKTITLDKTNKFKSSELTSGAGEKTIDGLTIACTKAHSALDTTDCFFKTIAESPFGYIANKNPTLIKSITATVKPGLDNGEGLLFAGDKVDDLKQVAIFSKGENNLTTKTIYFDKPIKYFKIQNNAVTCGITIESVEIKTSTISEKATTDLMNNALIGSTKRIAGDFISKETKDGYKYAFEYLDNRRSIELVNTVGNNGWPNITLQLDKAIDLSNAGLEFNLGVENAHPWTGITLIGSDGEAITDSIGNDFTTGQSFTIKNSAMVEELKEGKDLKNVKSIKISLDFDSNVDKTKISKANINSINILKGTTYKEYGSENKGFNIQKSNEKDFKEITAGDINTNGALKVDLKLNFGPTTIGSDYIQLRCQNNDDSWTNVLGEIDIYGNCTTNDSNSKLVSLGDGWYSLYISSAKIQEDFKTKFSSDWETRKIHIFEFFGEHGRNMCPFTVNWTTLTTCAFPA